MLDSRKLAARHKRTTPQQGKQTSARNAIYLPRLRTALVHLHNGKPFLYFPAKHHSHASTPTHVTCTQTHTSIHIGIAHPRRLAHAPLASQVHQHTSAPAHAQAHAQAQHTPTHPRTHAPASLCAPIPVPRRLHTQLATRVVACGPSRGLSHASTRIPSRARRGAIVRLHAHTGGREAVVA